MGGRQGVGEPNPQGEDCEPLLPAGHAGRDPGEFDELRVDRFERAA